METVIFVQGHLTTDALEEYAFSRLSEAEMQPLEEHLLVCSACQTSLGEVDEYILMMKEATAAYLPMAETAPMSRGGLGRAGFRYGGLGYTACAIALAGIGFLALSSRRAPPLAPEASEVPLIALRGGSPLMNHARAGRPLELRVDTTSLSTTDAVATAGGRAPAAAYRVEVVDAAGKPVWSGEIPPVPGPVPARIAGGLKAGVYWVRLYTGNELLREFGLLAD